MLHYKHVIVRFIEGGILSFTIWLWWRRPTPSLYSKILLIVAAFVAREVKYENCQKLAGHSLSFIPSLLDNLDKSDPKKLIWIRPFSQKQKRIIRTTAKKKFVRDPTASEKKIRSPAQKICSDPTHRKNKQFQISGSDH